jgi:hypothetical protein
MAKDKDPTIKNVFDGGTTQLTTKYDKKYLQYVQDFQTKTTIDALNAFRTNDLPTIEDKLKELSASVATNMYILGLGCVIIERERLYIKAGYNSYLEYAHNFFDEADFPNATMSTAKVIMERFIDYNRQLKKAGFRLEKNANKLRYLEEALGNHSEDEVYQHIVDDTFRQFRDYAQRRSLIEHKPEPDTRVEAEIKGDKLIIEGKNILNFPKGLSEKIRDLVKKDLQKTFSIRESGNQPFIISTYGKGEQTSLENYLKSIRAKK